MLQEGNQQGLEATRQGAFGMNTNDETETMTVSIPGKGLTEVTLNIGSMEEKAQACQAIIEHANALGATFGPHVPVRLIHVHICRPLFAFADRLTVGDSFGSGSSHYVYVLGRCTIDGSTSNGRCLPVRMLAGGRDWYESAVRVPPGSVHYS